MFESLERFNLVSTSSLSLGVPAADTLAFSIAALQDRVSLLKPLDRVMHADLQAPVDSQGDHSATGSGNSKFSWDSPEVLTHWPSKHTFCKPQLVPKIHFSVREFGN